jgi:hypothetical protein
MLYALDLLAGARYPKVSIQEFPDGWGLGVFSSVFGDARPFVRALLETGKCPLVRVQLAWRDRHDFSRKDFPGIVQEARKWANLVAIFPGVKWYFSGACENKLPRHDASDLGIEVLKVLPPGVTYVNSYIKGGAPIDFGINEQHGHEANPTRQGDFFSFDGTPCVDSNIQAYKDRHQKAAVFFFWDARFNLRWEDKDATPRAKRTEKGRRPDAKLLRSIIALASDPGTTYLPRGWIYKSHAENHGKGDPREEKGLVISPIKADRIELRSFSGVLLAALPYYGAYSGGGYRYYSSRWGYEISKTACEVWAGGKRYGVINPAFRAGTFR